MTIVVWRRVRSGGPDGVGQVPAGSTVLGLAGTGLALYGVQVIVGAMQIWTTLAAWAVSLHLALGAAIWGLYAAATLVAWYANACVFRGEEVLLIDSPSPKHPASPPI